MLYYDEEELKMERNNFKLYCCYSNRQKEYLMEKGFKYELIARNPTTNVLFWVFFKSEELVRALSEYKPYVV